jgi:hypothetical protein
MRGHFCLSVLTAWVLIWLGLSALLLVARGDLEATLRGAVGRHARPDAFEHLNGISVRFWAAHTSLTLVAIAAARYRRSDVLGVLLVGPVIALIICVLSQDWSDPNWFTAVAVCTIGWLASTVVGAAYWGRRPTARPA